MLFMSFLGFTSTRLGSEVFCPRTLPQKNPEDPVWLEPSTPGLRVKHFTTESHRTPKLLMTLKKKKPFKNIVGKGENAHSRNFLIFLCFLSYQRLVKTFEMFDLASLTLHQTTKF